MLTGLNPWALLAAAAFYVATTVGVYFYGHHQGVNSVKADLADAYQAQLVDFQGKVVKATKQATADALADFTDRQKVLDDLQAKLNQQQGTINAAATRLSASLKGGACVLQPLQRQLLECVRRPSSAGCSVPAPAR